MTSKWPVNVFAYWKIFHYTSWRTLRAPYKLRVDSQVHRHKLTCFTLEVNSVVKVAPLTELNFIIRSLV